MELLLQKCLIDDERFYRPANGSICAMWPMFVS